MLVEIGGELFFSGRPTSEMDAMTAVEMAAMTMAELSALSGNLLLLEGYQTEHRIEERSITSLNLIDESASYDFEYGEEVKIRDDNYDMVFGGLVSESTVTLMNPRTGSLLHSLRVWDYHSLADGRQFIGAYVTTTGDAIVRDILTILAEEGISEGEIQGSDVTLENIIFNYITCAEALDKVKDLCGFTWFINEEKKLYFVDRATFAAAWNIVDGSEMYMEGVTLATGNPEYRNIQYIQGGQAETIERTEPFIGDGTNRNFTLGYPVAKVPTITLNELPQSVGIKGVETGKNFYWSKGDAVITQEQADTVLTASDDLQVTYTGSFKIMVKVSQAAEITRQQINQGWGTGKIERKDVDTTLQSLDSAIDAAKAKLANYATIGRKLTYTTQTSGLAAGALQIITIPALGLSAQEFLITSVTYSAPGGLMQYDVEAVLGPVDESYRKLICDIAAAARQKQSEEAGQSDSIQGLEQFSKTWIATEHPNPFITATSTATPADTDFPCLSSDDRLKYLVLYTGGAEFFRKAITLQTQAAAEIDTTTIVLAQEANGTVISHVGLWGGNTCSATAATGFEMSKYSYSKTKTTLESLQFDMTDLKWV
jgi:hypothetical protein